MLEPDGLGKCLMSVGSLKVDIYSGENCFRHFQMAGMLAAHRTVEHGMLEHDVLGETLRNSDR